MLGGKASAPSVVPISIVSAAGLPRAGATPYRSLNGVWLVEDVPERYLGLLSTRPPKWLRG